MLVVYTQSVFAVEITHVYHKPISIDTSKKENVYIHFTINEQANVVLNVYDDRDLLVYSTTMKGLNKGDHKIPWSGRTNNNKYVPPEAYKYTFIANGITGSSAEYDVSDITGGVNTYVKHVRWNESIHKIQYDLTEPSRILIRAGIANGGPLLATLLNWEPRGKGTHYDTWDGKDASGLIDLSNHPNLIFSAQTYSLSANTILVTGKLQNKRFITIPGKSHMRHQKVHEHKHMFSFNLQKPEARGDYKAKLKLVNNDKGEINGIPIVSGTASILLTTDEKHRAIALARRIEPVFYIDGQMSYENEVGFLPATWNMDSTRMNNGIHYITANLRGYEGNFGIASIQVYVKNSRSK